MPHARPALILFALLTMACSPPVCGDAPRAHCEEPGVFLFVQDADGAPLPFQGSVSVTRSDHTTVLQVDCREPRSCGTDCACEPGQLRLIAPLGAQQLTVDLMVDDTHVEEAVPLTPTQGGGDCCGFRDEGLVEVR